MIIIKLQGGLGNQMFQYAFGYALAKQIKQPLKLDIYALTSSPLRQFALEPYGIDNEIATAKESSLLRYAPENTIQKIILRIKKEPRIQAATYFCEKESDCFTFNKNIPIQQEMYYEGFWQNEKYFLTYQKEIRRIFTPKKRENHLFQSLKNTICSSNSVSLHVRRGDYLTNPSATKKHGLCSSAYYFDAITFFKNKLTNPTFFVFSDDIAWSKKTFGIHDSIQYITEIGDDSDQLELELMRNCKHHIIANSTFSWWGAWLNEKIHKIVIAPSKWCVSNKYNSNDIIPQNWVRI